MPCRKAVVLHGWCAIAVVILINKTIAATISTVQIFGAGVILREWFATAVEVPINKFIAAIILTAVESKKKDSI